MTGVKNDQGEQVSPWTIWILRGLRLVPLLLQHLTHLRPLALRLFRYLLLFLRTQDIQKVFLLMLKRSSLVGGLVPWVHPERRDNHILILFSCNHKLILGIIVRIVVVIIVYMYLHDTISFFFLAIAAEVDENGVYERRRYAWRVLHRASPTSTYLIEILTVTTIPNTPQLPGVGA